MNSIFRYPATSLRWRRLVTDPGRRDSTFQLALYDGAGFVMWIVRVIVPERALYLAKFASAKEIGVSALQVLQSISDTNLKGYTVFAPSKRGLKIVPYNFQKEGVFYSHLYQKVFLVKEQSGMQFPISVFAEQLARVLFQLLEGDSSKPEISV